MKQRDAGAVTAPPAAAPPASAYQPPNPEQDESIQHSLFGEILDWMLAPLLLLWPMSIAITYLVAKSIANQPFDHALEDAVTVVAQQLREVDGHVVSLLAGSSREILRADDVDHVYFQVLGPRGEVVDGDRDLPLPTDEERERLRGAAVAFRNASMQGTPVRIAYTYVNLRPATPIVGAPASAPPAAASRNALVQVGETLDKRAQLANEIIKGVILPQFIILPIVLALVWFALARGLSPLAQLQERIRARRPDDLSPIDSRQVPEEISPLVGSLNDMLGRLSQTIDMQKRFIADAAHQMKTPLAGMRMQSELALRQVDPDEIHRSLEQLAKSSESATRLVNQLLALARAENQPHAGAPLVQTDLAVLARDTVPQARAQGGAGGAAGRGRGADRRQSADAARAAVEPDRQRPALHPARRQRDGAGAPRRQRRRLARGRGHRTGHRPVRAAARVRALLPDSRQRHHRQRPGSGHRARDRPAARRRSRDFQ